MNVSATEPTTALTQSAAATTAPVNKPADRALYLQILKSVGGNVNAALAALAAAEAKEASS